MMTPSDRLSILRSTRAILSNPDHWGRDHFCSDDDFKPCLIGEGSKYCILGAIWASLIAHNRTFTDAVNFLEFVDANMDLPKLPSPYPGDRKITYNIIDFNDNLTTTHADILAYLTTAITNLENTNA